MSDHFSKDHQIYYLSESLSIYRHTSIWVQRSAFLTYKSFSHQLYKGIVWHCGKIAVLPVKGQREDGYTSHVSAILEKVSHSRWLARFTINTERGKTRQVLASSASMQIQ